MAAQTDIQWADSTNNPWIGCTDISPACLHCYAATSTPSRAMKVEWGTGKPRHRTAPATRNLPLRLNAIPFFECPYCGWRGSVKDALPDLLDRKPQCPMIGCTQRQRRQPLMPARRRIFSLSLGDWLDNEVPAEWLADHLDVIRRTPNCDWLLLTKRIGNWRRRLIDALNWTAARGDNPELIGWIATWLAGTAPANVWLGITVVTQTEADRDVPKLLDIPAVIRFLSIEPMVEAMDIIVFLSLTHRYGLRQDAPCIDWVITGGESGSKARAPHPAWFQSLRDQCQVAGVAYLHKQNGEYLDSKVIDSTGLSSRDQLKSAVQPDIWIRYDGVTAKTAAEANALGGSFCGMYKVGKLAAGRRIDGREYTAFPKASA